MELSYYGFIIRLFPLFLILVLGIMILVFAIRSGQQKVLYPDISLEEAARMIERRQADPDFVILDIRTPEEFEGGHISEAVNIDFRNSNFRDQIAELDPDKTYLVYCRAGNRSAQSLPLFKELGFTRIYHLKEGYSGWVNL